MSRLPNYLRTYRKKLGLSQREMAILLGETSGKRTGNTLGRYENGSRLPGLESALGLELILGVPVRELFAGLAEDVAADIAFRASDLLSLPLRSRNRLLLARKQDVLAALAGRNPSHA